ncbi:TrbM/KikA/MpfK family conjugal transfer protein [Pseudomonas amygdali pv. morsprunorum]|uniref:TrbM/KikA/MpfK family conjugal transfer protein n=1 Tax=Pseudomonas amygdali TaxID=47877 RepID=UPI002892870B|nr:TrbM/KikA/MpfK family conjugal transfer protein [Pseudomonas amygdali]MDT3268728.1 TrbM/KikA/MpfK family conjugal transfer protein [Pseudomonas amygdali pv. morsprunorum]
MNTTTVRKTVVALAMSLVAGLAVSAHAGDTDACTVTLCMFGKLTGNDGGSECQPAEEKYFSIEVKKHGKFKPGPTFDARKEFLGECEGSDPAYSDKIMDKFGKVRG